MKWVLQVLARSKDGFIESAGAEGAPPIMAFVWYYMFGRDAVACALPQELRDEIRDKLLAESESQDEKDTVVFWQLIAQIETSLDESMEKMLRRYTLDDRKLLFGIFLSLRFIEDLRGFRTGMKKRSRPIWSSGFTNGFRRLVMSSPSNLDRCSLKYAAVR